MRVKELRQETAELTRYYEEYVSLRSTSLLQARSQENRIERLEEIKRELANYVKSHNSDALSRPGEPPNSRGRATPTQGLRHDYLVRRAWRHPLRRRRVRRIAAHPTRHQPGRGRVHHRTAGQRSWAGAPASGAAAAERGYRGRRGSLDRSGSSAAQRAGSLVLDAEPWD